MDLGRLGVWYAADKLTPAEWAEFISSAQSLGYGTLWYSEARGFESMALASYLLCKSSSINVGSSIANIYARDAVASRNGLYTLSAISGGRFALGLGVSHVPMVEAFRGHDYKKPVTTMRAYLKQMMGDAEDAAQWPVYLAALRPRMLELAAELTRGALPYNVTPEHTSRARAILGPDSGLAVEQKVCLETNAATARALARKELERYMGLDNYRNCWLELGFSESDLEHGGSDRFLDAMVAWGDVETVKDRIQAHFDAGADHVCIQPVHRAGDLAAATSTLRTLGP